MSWKDKLQASEVDLMQQIVDQVPEAMGVRAAFVNVLDKLATGHATGGTFPKFRFVVVGGGDANGTNDESVARECAKDEDNYVVDVVSAKWLISADESDDTDLTEAT